MKNTGKSTWKIELLATTSFAEQKNGKVKKHVNNLQPNWPDGDDQLCLYKKGFILYGSGSPLLGKT